MPPIEAAEHLLEYLFEIGPAKPAGMGGLAGLDEVDIFAWQANHDMRLSSWEIRTLRRLSHDYAATCADSKNPQSQPPYIPSRDGISDMQRHRISNAMSAWADKLNGVKDKS